MTIDWQWCKLEELDGKRAMSLFQLRQRIFILEQQCLYPDIDELDRHALQLMGWKNQRSHDNGKANEHDLPTTLVATLRLIPPVDETMPLKLGRIAVERAYRQRGLGQALVEQGIDKARELFPATTIEISAQLHLLDFYLRLGFSQCSAPYDEDGIEHIAMQIEG